MKDSDIVELTDKGAQALGPDAFAKHRRYQLDRYRRDLYGDTEHPGLLKQVEMTRAEIKRLEEEEAAYQHTQRINDPRLVGAALG